MTEIPADLRFLKSHEWVQRTDDGNFRVGISEHAQAQLGDLVYVELPEPGRQLEAGAACAVVESVKAASDVYAPIAGRVLTVNEQLRDKPEIINEDAFGGGWLFTLAADDASAFERLLDADSYAQLLAEQDH